MPDDELVARFARTNKEAYFEELYRRYSHLAFGVCMKMMKNEDDSRDVVSEVFRILYLKLPTANIQSFKSYLYTVSRNESLAKLRQRKSESMKMAEYQLTDIEARFMENEGLKTLTNSAPALESAIQKAVQQLGQEQQTCIRLFFYEDKSYKEICDDTGYTEKQVKSYLQNGKRNLRIMLEDEMKKHIA